MPLIDVSTLSQAIDETSPTGPDLDYDGDLDYMNFVARIEGQFPDSYFRFDRTQFAFDKEYETVSELLARTRDVRLLVILGRLQLLNRDVEGFRATFAGTAGLLEARWDEVHPRAEGGDYMFRSVALQSLEDSPTVLLPLAHVTLAETKRSGSVSYRTVQLALGKASPRTSDTGEAIEVVLDPGAAEKIFLDAAPADLRARRTLFDDIRASARRIAILTAEKAGSQNVTFSKLIELLGEIVGYLDAVLAKLEPGSLAVDESQSATDGDGGAGSTGGQVARVQGKVNSQAHVSAALAAVRKYFVAHEPSSPCLLLVRQAEGLVGKSFVDILRTLEPNFAEQATFVIGTTDRFMVPLERLAAAEAAEADAGGDPEEDSGSDWSGSTSDEESYEDTAAEEEAADEDASAGAEDGDESAAENGDESPDGGDREPAVAAAPAPRVPAPVAAEPSFKVSTRVEALEVVAQVESFYRVSEPSSPIPQLLVRVRELANRDFLSVLRDLLPASLLRPESE
jgi:type VI secretion system protein ImpA